MNTQLLGPNEIEKAAVILRSGGLVGIPTETVYGLEDYCQEIPPLAWRLAERFWPGPLTMILRRKPVVPDAVTAGLDTVGMRCPAHAMCRAIIRAAGTPIAAPSGNTSGKPSPTTAQHMLDDMEGKIDAVLDGGSCQVGVESTIVDLTCQPPRLLRPGGVPLEELRDVLKEIELDPAVTRPMKEGETPRAPGMKYRHYAPKAPVTVVKGEPARSAQYILDHISDSYWEGVITGLKIIRWRRWGERWTALSTPAGSSAPCGPWTAAE